MVEVVVSVLLVLLLVCSLRTAAYSSRSIVAREMEHLRRASGPWATLGSQKERRRSIFEVGGVDLGDCDYKSVQNFLCADSVRELKVIFLGFVADESLFDCFSGRFVQLMPGTW